MHISRRRRAEFALLSILMILASIAEMLSIGATLPFLGALATPEKMFQYPLVRPLVKMLGLEAPIQLLLPLTIVFGLAALLSGAMRLLLLWAQTRLSNAIGADFSISMYRRTLYQPYAVHVARNSSEVIAGIHGKATNVVGQIIIPILTILSSSLTLFSIALTLFAIDPTIAVTAFVGFGVIYASIMLAANKALMRHGQRVSQEAIHVIKALQEGLGGIRDVLIDGTQTTYCRIFRNADLPLRRAQANILIISNSPRFGIEALGTLLIAALAYSLAVRSEGFASAIPVLGALALGAQRLLPLLQQIYSNWSSIRAGNAYLRDALAFLEQPLPAHADAPLPDPIHFQHDVTLSKLEFSYAPQTPMVLRGLDLVIPKGSRIGIIGSTGSGKSTLLDIIMGLLQPSAGCLAIDGVSITEQNHRAWQMHIAHVPQVIFLADTSVTENIAFGVPLDKINHSRVRQVALQAQIAETIESLPLQYQTLVGERGIRLSGGQRQRIGIARALYKQADFIVFDEATSALDNDTERTVMEALDNLGDDLTVVIVAHRLTTLKNCTQIVELGEGRVKRIGSYEEIVEKAIQIHER